MSNNFLDFTSDKVDVFLMLIDRSGSMEDDEENVKRGLNLYKDSFESFPEKGSIAVSVSMFGSGFYPAPFVSIDNMSTQYTTGGSTALFYSIREGAKYLEEYMSEITREKNIIPRATFIVFSDGEPCEDCCSMDDGINAISRLNYNGINTVFVAFGDSIKSEFGRKLGFQATKDVSNRAELEKFLGVELSKSCKEQSKSLKSLGSSFFSKAVNSSSSVGYSAATGQVLEDDSWIDDI